MARLNTNVPHTPAPRTHEGAIAARISSYQQLRRSVLSCLLWENEFYESGEEIATRIVDLVAKVDGDDVAALAVEARTVFNLRDVPLLLLSALAKNNKLKAWMVDAVIQRADQLGELLAIHMKVNKTTKLKPILPAQMKKGLAKAFTKFNEYSLAKYNRDTTIKLRDVLFLCHAKPTSSEQEALWKRLVENKLATPDTWEVALSGGKGKGKKEEWTRLLEEKKLGYLALLRNLRNMVQADVDTSLISEAIVARERGAERVLPFRYIAAARACPQLEPYLDEALLKSIEDAPKFDGKTVILVDVSSSMEAKLSTRSDMTRMDAACALASIIHGDRRIFSFSNGLAEVPPRYGMAGVDAIKRSQPNQGTRLFDAVEAVNANVKYDRIIVITDEQATSARFGYAIQGTARSMPNPKSELAYVINVASAQNGVGYGRWTHIDGFSEGVIRYMHESEQPDPEPTERKVDVSRAMG